MSIGHKGMSTAAKILALSSLEFMGKPELVKEARKEHENTHKDEQYKTPFPKGLNPTFRRLNN